MEESGAPEVIVTVDGVPRPAVVVHVDGERTQVRYRDAGSYTTAWVATDSLIQVEPGRPRPPLLKLGGLVVVAVAGLLLLLHPGGSDTRLADLPLPSPSASEAASPSPSPTPSRTVSTPAAVTVTVLGDSLTAGKGNPAGTSTALQQAVRSLSWRPQVLAVRATGFTTGGAQAFGARLARDVQSAPDVLVLQGGASDTPATGAQLTTAVNAVIDVAQRRFPSTTIVLVGPVAMEQPPDGQLVRVSRVLASVARAQGVVFVDPIAARWITPANAPGYTSATGYYPNAAGHAYLGRKLTEALGPLGRRPLS